MSRTFEELQKISDSDFEILVTAYLRRYNAQLYGLILTGQNEQGRPIPCPVDNILYIPGNPPTCVAVASTTTARRALRGKWLGKEGDLFKAVEDFREWQSDNSTIHCLLYLATNRLLKSDVQLYRDVIRTGKDHNIDVEVVEASRLLDFLDFDADGQYIRETLLGIDAKRLSSDLLSVTVRCSLDHHRWTFALTQSEERTEVRRDRHDEFVEAIVTSSKPLIGLRGASGTGKSTFLRQIGNHINSFGGIALWVPAEEVVSGTSLPTMLLKVLRRFHPSLHAGAANELVELIPHSSHGLVLLVDDINALPSPHLALAALNSWGASLTADSLRWSNTIRIVVPLWPGQVAIKPDSQESNKFWEFIEIGHFSEYERRILAQSISEQYSLEIKHVIDTLHGDPFLCGLTSFESIPLTGVNRVELLNSIFNDALQRAMVRAQQTASINATLQEFSEALDALIALMLQTESPEPEWVEVRYKLGKNVSDILYLLAKTNQLGWIADSSDNQEIWRWKHTRLRDAIVGRWLANKVFKELLRGNLASEAITWLNDPGLAEAHALAITFLPANTHSQMLRILAKHQPLALAEVLRLNLFPTEVEFRQIIATGLRQSIDNFDERKSEFVGSPQRLILEKLAQTDDPLVLEITEGLPRSWAIWAARLRNGDLDAGLEWISREAQRVDFLPSVNFPFLEQSIEAFADLYNQKREAVAIELANIIKNPTLTNATLNMASYLAWPELIQPIWTSWMELPESTQLQSLASIVWFLSSCEDKTVRSKLETALLLSLQIGDEGRKEGKGSERLWKFLEPLRLTLWRSVSSTAAEAWANIIVQYTELRDAIGYLLGGIDHPATLEAYVRCKAERSGWSYWDESIEAVDPLAPPLHRHKVPIQSITRRHMWNIVTKDSDLKVRKKAFDFWKRSATQSNLHQLWSIRQDDPLFEDALKLRLKLRDKTTVELLIERMHAKPGYWCGYAPLLSQEEGVFEALLLNLDVALETDIRADQVIQHLQREQVRVIVQQKRSLILETPRIWPSLWHSEVPEALNLLQSAIRQSNNDDLKHFFTQRGRSGFVSPIMLNALVPVLHYFPEDELKWLADTALRSGYLEWVQRYLLNILENTAWRHFKWATEDGILTTLKAAADAVPKGVDSMYHDTDLFGLQVSLAERSKSVMSIMDVLKKWLEDSSNGNKITITAMLAAQFGADSDIDWWLRQKVDSSDEVSFTAWSNASYILKRRRWQGSEVIG